jgi:hypothetical protein
MTSPSYLIRPDSAKVSFSHEPVNAYFNTNAPEFRTESSRLSHDST